MNKIVLHITKIGIKGKMIHIICISNWQPFYGIPVIFCHGFISVHRHRSYQNALHLFGVKQGFHKNPPGQNFMSNRSENLRGKSWCLP